MDKLTFNNEYCMKSIRVPSFSHSQPECGKYKSEKLRIRTLFMQCEIQRRGDNSSIPTEMVS